MQQRASRLLLSGGTASAAVPIGQPMTGKTTTYSAYGLAALGTSTDTSAQ
jgi:hypothetical protein